MFSTSTLQKRIFATTLFASMVFSFMQPLVVSADEVVTETAPTETVVAQSIVEDTPVAESTTSEVVSASASAAVVETQTAALPVTLRMDSPVTVSILVNGSATPTVVNYDSENTISWTSTNASTCAASGDAAVLANGGVWNSDENHTQTTAGSMQFRAATPVGYDGELSFIITCSGDAGSSVTTVAVPVNPPVIQSNDLSVNVLVNGSTTPSAIAFNATGTVSWTSTNASACVASGDEAILVNGGVWNSDANHTQPAVGSVNFRAATPTGYDANLLFTITCSNNEGSVVKTVTLPVTQEGQPENPSNITTSLTINGSENPASVLLGSANTITWAATNASTCAASGDAVVLTNGGVWNSDANHAQPTAGSISFLAITSTGYDASLNFTLTCSNNEGTFVKTINLPVHQSGGNTGNENAPTVTIKVNGSESAVTLNQNDLATISWTSSNASTCAASGDAVVLANGGVWNSDANHAQPIAGFMDFRAITSAGYDNELTFTVTCSNTEGSASDTFLVSVNPTATTTPPTTTTPPRTGGGSGRYNGPCIGFGCPTDVPVDTTISGDIWILLDNVATTGNPAPAPAKVCRYDDLITRFMKKGIANDPAEVQKLQYFLNTYESANLTVSGIFDDATEIAVKAFQTKYAASILSPWGVSEATGIVYITTSAQINRVFCNDNPNYRNGDITDYTPSDAIYVPVDNSDDFTDVIGSATSTATSTSNLAAVFGAFKNVPWYSLLVLLLTLLGSWLIGKEIFKKDMKSPESLDRAMNGIYIFAAATVLNVLNTLSFMINPLWLESKLGVGMTWIIILDSVILLAAIVLVASHLIIKRSVVAK